MYPFLSPLTSSSVIRSSQPKSLYFLIWRKCSWSTKYKVIQSLASCKYLIGSIQWLYFAFLYCCLMSWTFNAIFTNWKTNFTSLRANSLRFSSFRTILGTKACTLFSLLLINRINRISISTSIYPSPICYQGKEELILKNWLIWLWANHMIGGWQVQHL